MSKSTHHYSTAWLDCQGNAWYARGKLLSYLTERMATGLENLKIYQMAEGLEIEVHEITKSFPKDELYRSVDQLRRSSASVSNTIAEGYSRYSYLDKIRYCIMAKGEAEETKRNLIRSGKKSLLSEERAEGVASRYTELLKAISGYINFLKDQKDKKERSN